MSICDGLLPLSPCYSPINDTIIELEGIFQESFPYTISTTLNGICYIWDETFIEKLQYSLSTDDLSAMSNSEKNTLNDLIQFEDGKSTSADDSIIGAIGCTIPDENGLSYVVTELGTTTDLCLDQVSSVPKESVSQALDGVLIALYNCEEYNSCGLRVPNDENGDGVIDINDLELVSACPVQLI